MKKPKAPRLVTVAIFTTITVIFWIFLSVYEILTTKAPVDVPPELLNPISPELDIEALNSIPQKMFFFEEDVNFEFVEISPDSQLPASEPEADTPPSEASPESAAFPQAEIDEEE